MSADGFIETTNLAKMPEKPLGSFRGIAARFCYGTVIRAGISGNDILDLSVLRRTAAFPVVKRSLSNRESYVYGPDSRRRPKQ